MTAAVVFAYHNVGVRCLQVLLAHGVDVRLVVTHEDQPGENIWFASVRELCRDRGLPFVAPDNPNVPAFEARVAALQADFLFCFYYRQMLGAPLLAAARRGAYNLHGSLLPKYRGRAPVNWAILQGETRTGASLHRMELKPDSGALVAQQAVPILPEDTATDVFAKVTVAAEICLDAALPELIAGTAPHVALDLRQGSYFGGRKPADGRIDWQHSAQQIHDLVRAVTHPYPGAWADIPAGRLNLWRTRVVAPEDISDTPGWISHHGGVHHLCPAGGGCLRLLDADLDGLPLPADGLPLFPPAR